MSDIEKLLAKTRNAFCVKEITTTLTYFNCFGDKIDEDTTTSSEVFIFDKDKISWHKGLIDDNENIETVKGYCDTCKHNGGYPSKEICINCKDFDRYEKGDKEW